MLDYRMKTFLTLCELLNYTRTAERLFITQPAVTQHIQYLEGHYHAPLFEHCGKALRLTHAGDELRRYALAQQANEVRCKKRMGRRMTLRVSFVLALP